MHEEPDVAMIERNYLFPGVIEMNYQARRRMGVNVYLIDGGTEYAGVRPGRFCRLFRKFSPPFCDAPLDGRGAAGRGNAFE